MDLQTDMSNQHIVQSIVQTDDAEVSSWSREEKYTKTNMALLGSDRQQKR